MQFNLVLGKVYTITHATDIPWNKDFGIRLIKIELIKGSVKYEFKSTSKPDETIVILKKNIRGIEVSL